MSTESEFIGDGSQRGDGGQNLQRLWEKWPWKPVQGQPGRYNMKKVGDGVPPQIVCKTSGVQTLPLVNIRKDLVIIELEGGGGLVSVINPHGTFLHTLNTKSSLECFRKSLV